jgi:hypothetical protein
MTPDLLLVRFRDEVNDAEEPYLWTDALVLDYIGESEVAFCRKTDGISDASTAEVSELQIVAGTEWYDLHPTVLKIRGAHRGDTGAPVDVLNVEDMASRGMRFDARTGPLRALITGIEERRIRVWPVPSETFTVHLTVFRMPLNPISQDNDSGTFEIGSEHHPFLLDWVKHLAYSKHDAETFDRTKADEHEAKFERYCANVMLEQRRLRHKPRSVAYGGI